MQFRLVRMALKQGCFGNVANQGPEHPCCQHANVPKVEVVGVGRVLPPIRKSPKLHEQCLARHSAAMCLYSSHPSHASPHMQPVWCPNNNDGYDAHSFINTLRYPPRIPGPEYLQKNAGKVATEEFVASHPVDIIERTLSDEQVHTCPGTHLHRHICTDTLAFS